MYVSGSLSELGEINLPQVSVVFRLQQHQTVSHISVPQHFHSRLLLLARGQSAVALMSRRLLEYRAQQVVALEGQRLWLSSSLRS